MRFCGRGLVGRSSRRMKLELALELAIEMEMKLLVEGWLASISRLDWTVLDR